MENKKIIYTGILVVIVGAIIAVGYVLFKNKGYKTTPDLPVEVAKQELAKKVEFVVIRVLPSGFSPNEVAIKKGMIVRFTNPKDTKVTLKWDGDQYTSEEVYQDHDIATKIFEKEGTYTFNDENDHQGKVVVK